MQYFLNGLPLGAIYAIVALSYSLIYASSGVLNWSQGDMVMLGPTWASPWFSCCIWVLPRRCSCP